MFTKMRFHHVLSCCVDEDEAGGQHHRAGHHHGKRRGEGGGCCRGEGHERGHGRGCDHGHERGHGGRGRGEGRGRGAKSRRLFEHGDLRMVLLALVAKKPSHGYELIKAIEEASSGLYVPSPGVIYPTLTLLEEQDLLLAEQTENGRKSYRVTPQGEEQLQSLQASVDHIFARLAAVGKRREGNLAEGIAETMLRLKQVLRGNMMRADLSEEQVARINQHLQGVVTAIESELYAASGPEEQK